LHVKRPVTCWAATADAGAGAGVSLCCGKFLRKSMVTGGMRSLPGVQSMTVLRRSATPGHGSAVSPMLKQEFPPGPLP